MLTIKDKGGKAVQEESAKGSGSQADHVCTRCDECNTKPVVGQRLEWVLPCIVRAAPANNIASFVARGVQVTVRARTVRRKVSAPLNITR